MTYPLSFVTKRGSSFRYKSIHVLRGRVSIGDIFVRGFFFFRCSEDFLYLFFSFYFRYIVLTFYSFYIYIEVVITFFHLSLHVLFLFSLYAHASYLLYVIFYLCFTLRCLDEFCLKCFRNTSCQSLSCHELSSCKKFSRVCVRIRFYCIQQVSIS